VAASGLAAHPLATPSGSLYPAPHSPLFDFAASAEGAGWIDDLARAATARRGLASTPPLPAHTDWSARNVRATGAGLVAVYDWDSLALVPESTAVGQAAATWCVTSEPGGSEFPTASEAIAFVEDYEAARGHPFEDVEWAAISGAVTWVLAYTARCEHALASGGTARPDQHGARDRLAAEAPALLDLGARR